MTTKTNPLRVVADSRAMPDGPRFRASHRAVLRRLGLTASIAIALASCEEGKAPPPPSEYGILRMKLFQQCMERFPKTQSVGADNDWSDAPENCSQAAYYVANTCNDPKACLAVLDKQEAAK